MAEGLGRTRLDAVRPLLDWCHFLCLWSHKNRGLAIDPVPFEHEYQTPFLPVWFAAGSATLFELAMPVLLIGGLFTRLATLPLIVMTAVIQFTYLDHIDHLYWILLLGLILTWGPGRFSLDALGERWLQARLPLLFDREIWRNDTLPHVIVVGAGFGGVAAARALKNAPCRVTVIDRHNYHLFQPLLYQVATAGLSPARYRRADP